VLACYRVTVICAATLSGACYPFGYYPFIVSHRVML
jgi:hypothetical protein